MLKVNAFVTDHFVLNLAILHIIYIYVKDTSRPLIQICVLQLCFSLRAKKLVPIALAFLDQNAIQPQDVVNNLYVLQFIFPSLLSVFFFLLILDLFSTSESHICSAAPLRL